MRAAVVSFATLLLAACTSTGPAFYTNGGVNQRVATGATYVWSFDDLPPAPGTGAPLSPQASRDRRFVAALGHWAIEHDAASPSAPNVYRQRGLYENDLRPRVIVSELAFGDLSARVKCRPESGAASESCGVMIRVFDSDNYVVARADAVDGAVAILRVVGGNEQVVASTPARIDAWKWHELVVRNRGERIFVWWDGELVVGAEESFWPGLKVGLWTGGDAVTAFDDFEVRAD